jgi:hypothetical protein
MRMLVACPCAMASTKGCLYCSDDVEKQQGSEAQVVLTVSQAYFNMLQLNFTLLNSIFDFNLLKFCCHDD